MCIATSPCHKAPLGTKLNTDQQCANKLIQSSQMQFLLDIHYHGVSRLGTNLDYCVLLAILHLESLLIFTKRVVYIWNLRMISVSSMTEFKHGGSSVNSTIINYYYGHIY